MAKRWRRWRRTRITLAEVEALLAFVSPRQASLMLAEIERGIPAETEELPEIPGLDLDCLGDILGVWADLPIDDLRPSSHASDAPITHPVSSIGRATVGNTRSARRNMVEKRSGGQAKPGKEA